MYVIFLYGIILYTSYKNKWTKWTLMIAKKLVTSQYFLHFFILYLDIEQQTIVLQLYDFQVIAFG